MKGEPAVKGSLIQASIFDGQLIIRHRQVDVEHGLAHISQRQGNQARYNGTRKNTYHLRIAAAVQNLERAQRTEPPALPRAA